MTDAVIVSTARAALATSRKGACNMAHGATRGGRVLPACSNWLRIHAELDMRRAWF
ncbi:hypothetical protein [Herminiimonas sp. CN]|uniref:hypothetical protein n=1 Tax=Herminiimonas sp. CN TaxID=1349818 RepID=UPI0012DC3DF7|nr:hypothetical protein [Herminiimonas sp. CN]